VRSFFFRVPYRSCHPDFRLTPSHSDQGHRLLGMQGDQGLCVDGGFLLHFLNRKGRVKLIPPAKFNSKFAPKRKPDRLPVPWFLRRGDLWVFRESNSLHREYSIFVGNPEKNSQTKTSFATNQGGGYFRGGTSVYLSTKNGCLSICWRDGSAVPTWIHDFFQVALCAGCIELNQ